MSRQQARYFTAVDHHDHEAVGAITAQAGEGIGIAGFIRDPHERQAAHRPSQRISVAHGP